LSVKRHPIGFASFVGWLLRKGYEIRVGPSPHMSRVNPDGVPDPWSPWEVTIQPTRGRGLAIRHVIRPEMLQTMKDEAYLEHLIENIARDFLASSHDNEMVESVEKFLEEWKTHKTH